MERVSAIQSELERLNALADESSLERRPEETRRLERALDEVSNQFVRRNGAVASPEPPSQVVREDAKIVLPDLDLVLRKVPLDGAVGDVSVIFFSETEITNSMYAAYLAYTDQWRDDSVLEKVAEMEPFSTASPSIHVSDPLSLWRKGAFPAKREDHPVSFITIGQAQEFCDWLSARYEADGYFRLPTEKEWLSAAYGTDRKYPWGDEKKSYTGRSTGPVKARPDLRTPDGLYGMWGNVSELVLSPYDGYGRKITEKHSPFITQWLGESFEEGFVRGKTVQPRQNYWGYTHSLKSRSDQWGFRIVFVPE